MKKGIDVSHWQGVINWDAVKADGIEFAILAVGFGQDQTDQDDAQFERNYNECKRLGIPVGAYLYSYATSVERAKGEANHALRLIQGKTFELPFFYDLEDAKVEALDNGTILEMAKAFCFIVSQVVQTGIYANKYWRTTKLTDAWYNEVPFWLAHYTAQTDYNGNYYAWQYSDKGQVNGINGNVDMNYLYGEFINNQPAPAPTPAPAPAEGHLHHIGENVVFSTCYVSSDAPNSEAIPASNMTVNHGVITKIVNAKNPYLLDDGLCWVNDGDIRGLYNGGDNAPQGHNAGDAVNLNDAPLYASSDDPNAASHISGTYYLYDGENINGRYRITDKQRNANRKPLGKYVTGWINL